MVGRRFPGMEKTGVEYTCKNCNHSWFIEKVLTSFKGDGQALKKWEKENRRKWNTCYCGKPFKKKGVIRYV